MISFCDNASHAEEGSRVPAIATIHLLGCDGADNIYAACPDHLSEYVDVLFIEGVLGQRLPFSVWPLETTSVETMA